jgi:hypothetical protein
VNRVDRLGAELDFLGGLAEAQSSITQVVASLRGLEVNDVLTAELATFDAQGLIVRDWPVSMGSIAITNLGTATITAHAGTPSEAPASGVGIAQFPVGWAQVVNVTGTTLTVYGRPGEKINLQVFTKPQPPGWGGAIGIGVSTDFLWRQWAAETSKPDQWGYMMEAAGGLAVAPGAPPGSHGRAQLFRDYPLWAADNYEVIIGTTFQTNTVLGIPGDDYVAPLAAMTDPTATGDTRRCESSATRPPSTSTGSRRRGRSRSTRRTSGCTATACTPRPRTRPGCSPAPTAPSSSTTPTSARCPPGS